MSELVTNCCNCGAAMQYSKQYYGSMYKCPYCGTEHHIDLLGRIEEYKVKLMLHGHLIEAYLSSYEVQHFPVRESYLGSDGFLHTSHGYHKPNIKLEFIGSEVDKVKE